MKNPFKKRKKYHIKGKDSHIKKRKKDHNNKNKKDHNNKSKKDHIKKNNHKWVETKYQSLIVERRLKNLPKMMVKIC
jgi:hypothetical protein